ncbi:unnamed protein product [Candidula unifasciata]|uniref:G-protein coupled receptors family 1 profile domain-containing protein n=1 Tax=Candidula unifasciata TaxID=100452 RepID=A0A8S3YXI0_9EUPU|nr:unnamed protein product [Candidula unifasciata]
MGDHVLDQNDIIRDVDNDIAYVVKLVFLVSLYPMVGVFGVGTNIVNVLVFCQHGIDDTVNVTLAALAMADIGSLFAIIFLGLCYNPLFFNLDVSFHSSEAAYLLAGMPRLCFSRIINLIVAFVTLEQCLCVRFPLRVKTMITPRRAVTVLVSIFTSMIASISPIYFSTNLAWKTYRNRGNKSLLGLDFSNNRREIDQWTFALGSVFGWFSFLLVFVCSIDLIFSLRRYQHFRKTSTTQSSNTSTRRDARVGKMVVVLSLVFIVSFIPLNAIQMCKSTIPRFNKGSDIPNIYHITWSVAYLVEAINSSINIFVYFIMSSKFKQTTMNLFARRWPLTGRSCQ